MNKYLKLVLPILTSVALGAFATFSSANFAYSWYSSPTPSPTAVPSPTATPTPTVTPTPTPTATPTPKPTATPSPTPNQTPTPSPTPATPGKITVCKIIVGADGKITNGSEVPGVSFSINGLPAPVNSGEGPGGVLGQTTFTTPLNLNTDLIGNDGVKDADCVTYNNLATGDFFYSQEIISNANGWEQPMYNDQFSSNVQNLNNFFKYDNGWFTHGYSDEKNADGQIILQTTRPERTLIVLNKLTGAGSSPTPAPTGTPSPSVVNNNSQEQNQTQNNNQTVTVNVTQGSVLGTVTKQPETGVPVLGLASFFSAAPFGLMLSKFGKGKITYKKKEELSSFALRACESRKQN